MKTIAQRILASLLVTVLVVLGGSGYLGIQNTMRFEQERLRREQRNTVARLAFNLGSPLWNLNLAETEKTIRYEVVGENVLAILVYDERGAMYAGMVRQGLKEDIHAYEPGNPMQRQLLSANQHAISEEIIKNGKAIGKVVLYENDANLKASMRQQKIALVYKLLTLLAALSCVLFFVLRKVVIQPMNLLKEWVLSFGTGQPKPVPDMGHCEEMDVLAGSFLKMVGQLARSKEEQEKSNRLLRSVMDNTFLLQGLLAPDGKLLEVNATALRMINVPKEAVLGHYFWETPWWSHDPALSERIRQQIARAATGESIRSEAVHVGGSGELHYIDFTIKPVSDEAGKIIYLLPEGRDITERRRAEEEKQKLESQLRQTQKMEAIGTLAGGIAHDFNNILSIIFGYNELAMMEKDPEKCHHLLAELQKGAKRAKELVGQILAFSRKTEQQKQPLQLSLIVKEALKMLRAAIPATIEIKQNIASAGLVLGDPTQIHQVIMNLCTNAYHAMRETGGILAVSLEEMEIGEEDKGYADLSPGSYLKLEVSDTGCGIEPEIQEKIFEPYFTTKKPGEGTGLGLAVVHGIVKSHHGHIAVYSELGHGTSFHVYLPLTEQKTVALPDKTPPHELRGNGERILVVDDEKQLCEILGTILSKYGYQVTIFSDAVQTWEEFQKNPEQFDLVLTDMTMPGMTGAELAQKILALRPQTPVVLCTGRSELINREKAMEMGIRDYLKKPVQAEQLLAAVKKALGH